MTPSARMLAEMRERRESFFDFTHRLSQAHRQAYLARPLPLSASPSFRISPRIPCAARPPSKPPTTWPLTISSPATCPGGQVYNRSTSPFSSRTPWQGP